MCMRAQKRRKRNETLKLESNPVYATYQADTDPVAEVIFNECFFLFVFKSMNHINDRSFHFLVQVEDVNVHYGEVYEGERSRHTDNNPLYD